MAETEEARVARVVRLLPAKARKDVLLRLAGSIKSLESIVERGHVNDDVAVKLSVVVSGLRTARLLLDSA